MAINKQAIPINFSRGLDSKTDPKQVALGNFLALQNTIFDKGGLLQKRNGYQELTPLPDTSYQQVTTFNGNLTAIGSSLVAYSQGSGTWVNTGQIQPMDLSVAHVVRSNTNQIQCDSVVSSNNIVCTVYADNNGSSTTLKYTITDYLSGQSLVAPKAIVDGSATLIDSPRVFLLGNYFVIVYGADISGTNHLRFITVSTTNPNIVTAPTDISSAYLPSATMPFDGVVTNNTLYISWNASDIGGAQRIRSISSKLVLSSSKIVPNSAGKYSDFMTLSADESGNTPVIWGFYHHQATGGYSFALDQNLNTILSSTDVVASGSTPTIVNAASVATSGIQTLFFEVLNQYTYDSAIPTNYIKKNTVTFTGVVGSATTLVRSVGLASKAFMLNNVPYFLAGYQSVYQPSYFMINGNNGGVVAKLAYSNAYTNTDTSNACLPIGLPSALVQADGATVDIAYLYKDLISAVNKTQGLPNASGIYSQTGVNLASFVFNNQSIVSEMGNNLNLSGGLLWSFDGAVCTENNFNVWPDSIEATWSATGGTMAAKPDGSTNANAYFYQVLYEWTDLQGNIVRSAPSIPTSITTTGSGYTGSVVINIPTLRLTYKTANPVKCVCFRWSVAQQSYYQSTTITQPVLNDPTVDYVTFTDTLPDSSIIGNALIYTTGGVVEDIGPPATKTMTLFDDRLWLVDAEDQNLLWYSKQVIESTPVELSDLFTLYIAPNISVQQSQGPISALAAMDDKLIVFRANSLLYLNGQGPDNTGANSTYSQPTYISSTVGCVNQNSIVLTPNGLLFQSDKGIWELNRSLQTSYIGAPVEQYNSDQVVSALTIPGTNQVRFTLNSGVVLMYDYYYGQWGTFNNVPAISSTLYQNLHTFINSFGQVYQETPGAYLDGSSPVLISFTTSWINLAGLQGYQRSYYFYLLGTFFSPHKLNVLLSYDYAQAPSQQVVINPTQYNAPWGDDNMWDVSTPWGGTPVLEQWKVNFAQQLCSSFQITVTEIFDSFFGTTAGAGATFSGLNLIVGLKKGFRPIAPAKTAG